MERGMFLGGGLLMLRKQHLLYYADSCRIYKQPGTGRDRALRTPHPHVGMGGASEIHVQTKLMEFSPSPDLVSSIQ